MGNGLDSQTNSFQSLKPQSEAGGSRRTGRAEAGVTQHVSGRKAGDKHPLLVLSMSAGIWFYSLHQRVSGGFFCAAFEALPPR